MFPGDAGLASPGNMRHFRMMDAFPVRSDRKNLWRVDRRTNGRRHEGGGLFCRD